MKQDITNTRYVHWTMQLRNRVRHMYIDCNMTADAIAETLGIPPSKIGGLLTRMNLIKGKNAGEFKPGAKPWNYGKKGVNGVSSTRFAKGHNAVVDGSTKIRKTKEGLRKVIYISGKELLLHRHVYTLANPGFTGVVKFIDGDPMNCDVSNLYGITRAENMERNRIEAGTPRKKSIAMRAAMRRKYNDMQRKANQQSISA